MSGMTLHAAPYVVPSLCAPFQLVLGTDFLEQYRGQLDFGHGNVVLHSGLNTLCLAFDRTGLPAPGTPAQPAHAKLTEDQPVSGPRHVRKRDRRLQNLYCSVIVRVGDAMPHVPAAADLQSEIPGLTSEYADLFQEPTGLPPVRSIEHVIDLQPGTEPAYTKPYRLSAPELAELDLQITDLLRKGLIEPSNSPYGAPVFFVSKADGSLRPVFDYRKLNANLVPQRFPLPRIDELLDRLHGAQYFTSLDLKSGFHQVRLRPEDKPKTAFTTPVGHYQWCVSPFGLQSSPSTFQRLMSSIFAPAAYTADGLPHVHAAFRSFVLVYIDDILIYSKTASEHLAHLRAVFDTLRQHTIFLKQKKCKFGLTKLKFLGHIVSSQGVSPDPDKVKAVADWPVLQDVHDVQCFMGLCNYFRKFIPGYAQMVRPITQLTRKSTLFVWGGEQQGAFEAVKNALISAPVLAVPDLNADFDLVTDASDYGLGALLMQKGRPIAYESRGLNAAELNYGMPDKELLAVIWALTKWRCYLQARRFKVITDHQPSVAFPRCNLTAHRRRARWADFLSQFSIEWVYTPGKKNVADPLSRVPGLQRKEHVQFNLHFHVMCAALTRRQRALAESQTHAAAQQSDMPEHAVAPVQHPDATGHTVVYTPERSGEQGVASAPSIVSEFVRTCDACQRNKAPNTKPPGTLEPLQLPSGKFTSVSSDFIVGLPETPDGHDAICVFVDRLTKYAIFCPTTSNCTAEQWARLFTDRVFRDYGLPEEIITDRGPQFTSKFSEAFADILGVTRRLSTSYHPQTDGQTERFNHVLEDMLRAYVSAAADDWADLLPMVQFAVNNSWHESVQDTPMMLLHGFQPKTPCTLGPKPSRGSGAVTLKQAAKQPVAAHFAAEIQDTVRRTKHNLLAAQSRWRKWYDPQRVPLSFAEGDMVLLSTKNLGLKSPAPKKLLPRYVGPFPIVKRVGRVAYKLQLPANWFIHNVFHVSLLRAYKSDGRVQPPPLPTIVDGDLTYNVESLVGHRWVTRGKRRKLQYLVKWEGYPIEHNTFEPAENMHHLVEDLQRYRASQPDAERALAYAQMPAG